MTDEAEDSAEQFIEFKCPYCGGDNAFPGYDAGAIQECPFCPEVFLVPLENGSPGRPIPIPIATPRLNLRRLRLEDNGDLAEFMGNEELLRYMDASEMDEASISDWLKRDQSTKMFQSERGLYLGIELRENDKLVGWAWMDYSREAPGARADREASFSLVINPLYQRKGYGLEVVQKLLTFGFTGINLRRITAAHDSRNLPAKALLTRAGLRFEGEFFQERFVKSEWVDTSYFALLADEYEGGSRSQSPPS